MTPTADGVVVADSYRLAGPNWRDEVAIVSADERASVLG